MEIISLDTRAALVGWPVFRDGNVRRFLILWVENQIARMGKRLERVTEEELKNVQGQIEAFRTVRTMLDLSNIETAISELTKL